MASLVYNQACGMFARGEVVWGTTALKLMLVTAAYVPSPDHDFVSSASAYELSGTGYVDGFNGSGRKVLAYTSSTPDEVLVDDTNDYAALRADNVVWSAIDAGTAQAALLIKEETSDSDSPLIAYIDLVEPRVTSGDSLTLVWNSVGILTVEAA
jgi:hypothetical protein